MLNLLQWCSIIDAVPVLQIIVLNKVIKSNPKLPDGIISVIVDPEVA